MKNYKRISRVLCFILAIIIIVSPLAGNGITIEASETWLIDQLFNSLAPTELLQATDTENINDYAGKVVSILGDSISTFAGYIPTADGFNREHLPRYPQDNLLTDVNETWWMQVISGLNAKLGINDSWRGATLCGAAAVTTGDTGENAALSNLIRIQNLGSNGTPDVILLYGGTNDLAHISNIGSFDPSEAPAEADLTTKKWNNLADGFLHTVLRIRYYYPDAELVVLLPTYTASYYTDEKLAQGNALMAAICEHYGVTYLDLRDSGVTAKHLPDGIHPGAEGMDLITESVLEVLLNECEVEAGENVVYSVKHVLNGAKSSLSYYKGVSANKSFVTAVTGEDLTVAVTMGGADITSSVYADGLISIPEVTGDIVITAQGRIKPVYEDHLQELPEKLCSGTDIWKQLEHDTEYYTVDGWGVHPSGQVRSVTLSINAGDRLWATSFGESGTNGGSMNGIRVTFFDANGVMKSMAPDQTYAEFTANGGYLIAPEGAVAVNIPMWTSSDANEIYLLDRAHNYSAAITFPTGTKQGYTEYTCSSCGDSYRAEWLDKNAYSGKTIACIGDSITAAVGVTKDVNDYVKLLADELGMNYIRLGVSGTTLCTDGSRTCNIGKLTESNLSGADVVTIAMGINDFCAAGKGYYELGDINSTDSSTIYGAMRMWCERIVELQKTDALSDTQFYFLTPVITSWNNSVTSARDWDQSKTNVHGYTLRDLCNAIIEVAALYDVPVIDVNLLSGLYYNSAEDNTVTEFGGDGVHPGAKGHEMMAAAMADVILQNNLRNDHEHSFGSWVTTTWPFCRVGKEQRVCSVCSATECRSLDARHNYSAVITPPTCTEGGYTTHTCACGESYVDGHTDARGYDWMLEDGEFKILLIGNSFSEDASNAGMPNSQMLDILQAMLGDDIKITVGLCYSGGKGLNWHATQSEQGNKSYSLRVISTESGKWKSLGSYTSADALEWTDWDVVSLQHYEINTTTGKESNAYPAQVDPKFDDLEAATEFMLDYVDSCAPQAAVYFYMHWARAYKSNLNESLATYNKMAEFFPVVMHYSGPESERRFETIIPVGLSVQNARTTYLSLLSYNTTAYADGNLNLTTDAQIGLQRDGGHLSYNVGRYIAALTFAEMIIPEQMRTEGYILPDIRITESVGKLPKEYTEIAQKAVMAAVTGWKNGSLAVTNISGYEKAPTSTAGDVLRGSILDLTCSENPADLTAKIGNAVLAALPEDFAVDAVSVTGDASFGESFSCEVTIRFGYTSLKVPVNCIVSVHNYSSTVTPPTCTEKGYTTHTCACGESYVDGYTDAKGHSYVDTTCTVCGYSYVINVTVVPENPIPYTLDGRTVTITHDKACKVGYLMDGSYVAIEAVANEDGSYSFTVPEEETGILIGVKADLNANGALNSADRVLIARALLSDDHPLHLELSAEELFFADIDNDGVLTSEDLRAIASALMYKSSTSYQPIVW